MAEVTVPRYMFADNLALITPVAATSRAGVTSAEVRCGDETTVEACLNGSNAQRAANSGL
jgi:hypothetical protein